MRNPDKFIITKLNSELMGVATKNNKPLIVRGALPDEEVTLINVGKKKGVLKGQADIVDNHNTLRIKPKCLHSSICGGCGLQHISTNTQLELKQKFIAEEFAEFANLHDIKFNSPINAEPWGYRRKARLGVKYVHKKDTFLVGFREFNSIFLADIKSCNIIAPKVGHKLIYLRELIAKLSCNKKIPQIEVTAADNATALLIRHLTDFNDDDIKLIQEFGKEHDFIIYLQPNSYENSYQIYPNIKTELYYDIPKHKLRMFFKVYDFIQVNREINLKLIDKAIDYLELDENDNVLEGFCGIGNFSLPFAKYAKSVTAIEYSESLLDDAAKNSAHNKITNINFVADDLYNCKKNKSYSTNHNKLFLDPPRSGAGPWLDLALACKPSIIVYVSCNSTTLAKDTKVIIDAGYELKNIALADMFPHTSHVETIAQFKLKG